MKGGWREKKGQPGGGGGGTVNTADRERDLNSRQEGCDLVGM